MMMHESLVRIQSDQSSCELCPSLALFPWYEISNDGNPESIDHVERRGYAEGSRKDGLEIEFYLLVHFSRSN